MLQADVFTSLICERGYFLNSVYLRFITLLLSAIFALAGRGYALTLEGEIPADARYRFNDWAFLPEAILALESEFYTPNDADYTMVVHRIILLDILRYRSAVLSLTVDEAMRYKESGSNYIYPHLIRNQMDFVNLRLEFPAGVLSWFIDHSCNNNIDQEVAGSRRFRWYGTGLRWETWGMRPGHRDEGMFDNSAGRTLLSRLNYSFTAAKSLSTRHKNYKALFEGALRYDIIRSFFLVPYLEGSIRALYEEKNKVDRALEAGMRIGLERVTLMPFVRYMRLHDVDLENERATGFYLYGFRLEALVGGEMRERYREETAPIFLPGIHFSGGYAYHVLDAYLYFNSDILFEIDLLRFGPVSVFANNRLSHSSSAKSKGLYPRYLFTTAEAGLTLWLKHLLIEPLYHYGRRDEGNYYRGYNEQYSIVALRLKSPGMKTGNPNHGISFATDGFSWLNRIHWLITPGRVVQENSYHYDWDLHCALRWDIFRYWVIIPYLAGSAHLIYDEEDESSVGEYSAEGGVRMRFGVDLILFYRYYYRTEPDIPNGIDGRYHLMGLRLEI